jgi:hypothetical protein
MKRDLELFHQRQRCRHSYTPKTLYNDMKDKVWGGFCLFSNIIANTYRDQDRLSDGKLSQRLIMEFYL